MKLNNLEFTALCKVARKTNCDCWFCLVRDKKNDYVWDIENNKKITIKQALLEMEDAIIDPLENYGLTHEEINAINNIYHNIKYNKI